MRNVRPYRLCGLCLAGHALLLRRRRGMSLSIMFIQVPRLRSRQQGNKPPKPPPTGMARTAYGTAVALLFLLVASSRLIQQTAASKHLASHSRITLSFAMTPSFQAALLVGG